MLRGDFSESAERIGHENLALCLPAHLDDLFHRDFLLDADQSAFCEKYDSSEKSRVNGIVYKCHLSVFHPHVEEALHLCQRIFFYLFCNMPVA